MGFGKPFTSDDKAHDDLFAIGPMVARIAAFRLGNALRLTFEICAREIVEQTLFSRLKRLCSRSAKAVSIACDGIEAVEIAIQPILMEILEIDAEDVREAVARIQSGMAYSAAGWIRRLRSSRR